MMKTAIRTTTYKFIWHIYYNLKKFFEFRPWRKRERKVGQIISISDRFQPPGSRSHSRLEPLHKTLLKRLVQQTSTLLFCTVNTGSARDCDPHRQKYWTPNFLGFFGFVKTIKLLITQKKLRHENKITAWAWCPKVR
jgi:hypothetical protein